MGGVIPEACWSYGGQEHATIRVERKRLNQLLKDSAKDLFDAVIVCDPSRWSRDNLKSKQGLEILRRNGRRFFVGTSEYDLTSPQHRFFLGMSAELNEFIALEQSRKSMINRIERAKRNIPTSGKLPYGRTFRRGKWGLEEEKVQKIHWAANQYLNGHSMERIAQTLGMNLSNLWKILTKRSGDVWEIKFESEKLDILETIKLGVPPILSEEKINAIHEKAAANKTFSHGKIKNEYMLSRMIFCACCGYAMVGQTNPRKKRYYRHARKRLGECGPRSWIPAGEIEKAVMIHVFEMFGDTSGLEKAIKDALPDRAELEELQLQKAELERESEEMQREKDNLIDCISKKIIEDEDARKKMKEIRERDHLLNEEIGEIGVRLDKSPSREKIEARAKAIKRDLNLHYGRYERISEMSYEEKRNLFQNIFAGRDAEGNRFGVYVEPSGSGKGSWKFTIKGGFIEKTGWTPISLPEIQCRVNVETEFVGDDYDPTFGMDAEGVTNLGLCSRDRGLPGSCSRSGTGPPRG